MSDLQEVAKSNDESDSETEHCSRSPSVFSNTAIDMFGPLQINRKTLKEAQVIIYPCKSGPSRACNRQKLIYVSYGFSEICLTQKISQ